MCFTYWRYLYWNIDDHDTLDFTFGKRKIGLMEYVLYASLVDIIL